MRQNCLPLPPDGKITEGKITGGKMVGFWTVALLGLTLFGCGGRDHALVDVSGIVTMDGKPLADASVIFTPVGDGVGPASASTTDASGWYVLKTIDLDLAGAVPGVQRVTITTARANGDDERATISKERVPPQYRDGSFRLEISAEGNLEADIEILSKRE